MKSKKWDWTKVTGGNNGGFYTGRRWESFQCLYCAVVAGQINYSQRRQLADVAFALNKIFATRGYDHKCQGAKMHREFFRLKAAGELPGHFQKMQQYPIPREVAVFKNEEDGVLTDVTQTSRGFLVRLKDTDANEFLGTVRIFPDKADAIAFAKKAVGWVEPQP